jgi:hypothetical protein
MFVEYVWPFRELRDSTERKTFFWLECSYDEAMDVLRQVKLSADDFRSYVEHLYEFRSKGLGDRQVDQGLEVYTRIGFLISEDGKIVEWAPPGFPISNMWDAYNPFKGIHRIGAESFAEFSEISKQFANEVPYYSNLDDETEIVERFKLESFKGTNPSAFLRDHVQTTELGRTAVKVFLERYCDGASIDGLEYFNSDPVSQWELGHLYLDLLKSNSQQTLQNPPAQGIDFLQITLREVFARKRRAVQNLRKLENIIKGEDSGPSRSPLVELKQLSDDEICELALLMERYTWSVAIKWIFGEFIERVSRRGEGYSLLSTVDHYEFPDGFIFPTKPTPQTRRDFGDDQIIQDLIYPYPDE